MFLAALVNLDPYDFAEEVAAFYVGDNENNQQTAEEVLSSTITALPDEKLTQFALRFVLTGHTDIPREHYFDFLAQAQAVFTPPKAAAVKARKPDAKAIVAVVKTAAGEEPPNKKAA